MIKWDDYFALIPAHVKIGKSIYHILWTDEFPKDKEQLGETRFDGVKQIVIKTGQSNKEAVSTYWHELLHAASEEYDVKLTENQVLRLEKLLKDLLKPGNMLVKEKRKNESKSK